MWPNVTAMVGRAGGDKSNFQPWGLGASLGSGKGGVLCDDSKPCREWPGKVFLNVLIALQCGAEQNELLPKESTWGCSSIRLQDGTRYRWMGILSEGLSETPL